MLWFKLPLLRIAEMALSMKINCTLLKLWVMWWSLFDRINYVLVRARCDCCFLLKNGVEWDHIRVSCALDHSVYSLYMEVTSGWNRIWNSCIERYKVNLLCISGWSVLVCCECYCLDKMVTSCSASFWFTCILHLRQKTKSAFSS